MNTVRISSLNKKGTCLLGPGKITLNGPFYRSRPLPVSNPAMLNVGRDAETGYERVRRDKLLLSLDDWML